MTLLLTLRSLAAHFLAHCPHTALVLSTVGAMVVALWLLRVVYALYSHFLRGGLSLKRFGAGAGAWAVVTGSTDGIGKEYALQLARAGFNVLLVSRSVERLTATQQEIQTKYPKITVNTFAMDFSAPAADAYTKLRAVLASLGDIGVLVNNVGVSYEMPTLFHELDVPRLHALIDINVKATTEVTYYTLPLMVAKKRGLVINISSSSSLFPSPLLSVYGATKAYVNHWSQSLAAEYAKSGIVFECQTPFFVISKLSKISRPSFNVPRADVYVRTALSKLGQSPLSNPFFPHAVTGAMLDMLPDSVKLGQVHKTLAATRARALKKAKQTN